MGFGNIASDFNCAAIGQYSNATNTGTMSFGFYNDATEDYSSAIGGYENTASGTASFASGYYDTSSGKYSYTLGKNSKASGFAATVIGDSSVATGGWSLATGKWTRATGNYSSAFGLQTKSGGTGNLAGGIFSNASGLYSIAYGYNSVASGNVSYAIGDACLANGSYSVAIGRFNKSTGQGAFTLGYQDTANANYSFALGSYVSSHTFTGSFTLGDQSTTTTMRNTANNRFRSRFDGGYYLYSNTALTSGVYMNNGVSGWTNVSDRNKKENFEILNGESILDKISKMQITKWNYKGIDSIKYIGPMAQDFYAAFNLGGKDSLGINTISIDGVNMAAIQALEKRTQDIDLIKNQNETLINKNNLLLKRIEQLEMKLENNNSNLTKK